MSKNFKLKNKKNKFYYILIILFIIIIAFLLYLIFKKLNKNEFIIVDKNDEKFK